MNSSPPSLANRFRGYLPVIIDIETAGFNAETDALLELAAITVGISETGTLHTDKSYHYHIAPFPEANLEPAALAFNGIDPFHPFRGAVDEKAALTDLFSHVRHAIKRAGCKRAVLVGHNPWFDLSFIRAAITRNQLNHNPFHSFTTFDTATLAGLIYGETVLAKAVTAAGLPFDKQQAHSALYDAQVTAELFCKIVNAVPYFNLSAP